MFAVGSALQQHFRMLLAILSIIRSEIDLMDTSRATKPPDRADSDVFASPGSASEPIAEWPDLQPGWDERLILRAEDDV